MTGRATLAIALLAVLILPTAVLCQTPPPASGDWTIYDITTITGQSLVINGNVFVKSGGLLILDNVSLLMNCTTDGQYTFKVESGGELRMNNTLVTSPANATQYKFQIMDRTTITNSTIERVWGAQGYLKSGIEVLTGNASFVNCTVRYNKQSGISLNCTGALISNCRILDVGQMGIFCFGSGRPTIESCVVDRAGWGGITVYETAAPSIINCDISNGYNYAIECRNQTAPAIRNCRLRGGYVTITIEDQASSLVENCSISGALQVGFQIGDFSTPRIINNTVFNHTYDGFFNAQFSSPVEENNTVYNTPAGFYCRHDTTARMANNTVFNCTQGFRVLDRTKGQIVGNRISRVQVGIQTLNFSAPLARDNIIDNASLYGVDTIGTSSPTVRNNIILDSAHSGIHVTETSNPLISENVMFRSRWGGVWCDKTSRGAIENNTISNSLYDGLVIMDSTTGRFTNNSIVNSTAGGVLCAGTSTPRLERNIIDGAVSGIECHNFSAPLILGNIIRNITGLGIVNRELSVPRIENNSITLCGAHLIESYESAMPTIVGNNLFGGSDGGIVSFDTARVEIENNTINDNVGVGIYCTDSASANVSGNILSRNRNAGIKCEGGSRFSIFNNTFEYNPIGISIFSSNGTISSNKVRGGSYGIEIKYSSPTVSGCLVYDSQFGIHMTNSSSIIRDSQVMLVGSRALDCDGASEAMVLNSTLRANVSAWHMWLSGGSHTTALNTEFEQSKVSIEDNSSLRVMWFLTALIKDMMDRPLADARVAGAGGAAFRTDVNGIAGWMPLEEKTVYRDRSTKAVHSLLVEKDGDSNTFENISINHSVTSQFRFDFAPCISPLSDIDVTEGTPYTLDLTDFLSDRDSELGSLNITVSGADNTGRNASLDGKVLVLNYSLPAASDVLLVNVTDGIRTTGTTLNVSVGAVNDRPVLKVIPVLNLTEDVAFTLDLSEYVTDEDDSITGLTLEIEGQYMTVDGFLVTFLYPEGVLGDLLQFRVSDGHGGFAEGVIYVSVAPVNDPPAISNFTEREATEDVEYLVNMSMYVSDPDTPLANLTITTNSTYASIYTKLGGLWLRFLYPEGVRKDHVRVTVSDGQCSTAVDLVVTVKPVNDPPVVGAMPSIAVLAGKDYSMDLGQYISDIDTARDKLSLTSNSQFVRIVGFNATIRFPKETSSMRTQVYFEVSDGQSKVPIHLMVNVTAAQVEQKFVERYSTLIYILVPVAIIGTAVGILAYRRMRYGWYDVSRVMAISLDGRFLAQAGSEDGMDKEIVSGMLTAIQSFINEAMASENAGAIKEFNYEGMKIAVERGSSMYLAVFLKGNVTDGLRKRMRRALDEIAEKFGKVLIDWDGDIHKVEPIKENLAFLMGKSR